MRNSECGIHKDECHSVPGSAGSAWDRAAHEAPAAAAIDVLDLNEALQRLEQEEPQKAELVKLRFFAGLSLEDAAEALAISPATAKRYWAYSRARLYGWMSRK